MEIRISGYLLLLFLLLLGSSIASVEEVVPEVDLVVDDKEISAFSSRNDNWVTVELDQDERVRRRATSANTAVAVTNERLLGFSAFTNTWHEQDLDIGERLRRIQVDGNIATVVTNSRFFAFDAQTGQWVVETK